MRTPRAVYAVAAFALIAMALLLAGCGQRPPTALDGSVASACIEARAEHRALVDFCDVTRACRAADVTAAAAIRRDADAFCARSPATTPENLAAVHGFTARLQAIERTP